MHFGPSPGAEKSADAASLFYPPAYRGVTPLRWEPYRLVVTTQSAFRASAQHFTLAPGKPRGFPNGMANL
jgi:hypothetical protein